MTSYAPEQNWSHTQLTASSTAAGKNGVPVYVLRGVTGYKYGPGATTADFSYVAGQLSGWYTHYYKQSGNALIAWQHAAAQEMPGASGETVAAATSYVTTALTGMQLAPTLTGIGELLTPGIGAIEDVGATIGDVSLAGTTDTAAGEAGGSSGSSVGSSAGGNESSDSPGAGTGSSAASTAAKAATVAGLAGLLGLTGWGELLVRGLEALAGAALILLGLQALTGQGSGNPIQATRAAAGRARG